MKGKFITFEGIDGSGKTSQMEAVVEYLRSRGIFPVITREPGGTKIGEIIRDVLLDTRNREMLPETEALLYAASRAQHVKEVILPALMKGKWVVCDRFLDASLAYQGVARDIGIQRINEINRLATGGIKPHLTLLLDVKPEMAAERKGFRKSDRLEREGLAFYEKVRQGYLMLAKVEPQRIKVIDGGKSFEMVKEEITNVLEEFLSKAGGQKK
jgi:dTMP kinase